MVQLFAWGAVTAILMAIVYTQLSRRRLIHLIGLICLSSGFASIALRQVTYDISFIWLSIGAIWLGIGGVVDERFIRKPKRGC